MAGRRQQVGNGAAIAVAVVAALLVVAVEASRPGAALVCNVDQSALETCRSYCARGSTEGKPNPDCCAALKNADFKCFCGYKGLLRAYRLDPNRAMQIPTQCGLDGATANPCG